MQSVSSVHVRTRDAVISHAAQPRNLRHSEKLVGSSTHAHDLKKPHDPSKVALYVDRNSIIRLYRRKKNCSFYSA